MENLVLSHFCVGMNRSRGDNFQSIIRSALPLKNEKAKALAPIPDKHFAITTVVVFIFDGLSLVCGQKCNEVAAILRPHRAITRDFRRASLELR